MDTAVTALQIMMGVGLVGLAVLSSNLLLLTITRLTAHSAQPPTPAFDENELPHVLVQLPLFNEGELVEPLLDAVAALDWPHDRLSVQVLDDSTDGSVEISRRAVARHIAAGLKVELLHRTKRDGYKAGALAAGLERTDAEYIAILDADFVPSKDLLHRLLPTLMADEGLAFVQARWGHGNRDANRLTLAQAALLDAHFAVEHEARHRIGLPIQFNGTCGVWRRGAIHSAGGWQGDTLTEDMDLSIRAQLHGWRAAYRGDVVVDGELPESARAWRSQQSRWTKGGAQCAVKLVPRVWRADWPVWKRLAVTLQISQALFFPLGLFCMLTSLPLIALEVAFHPALVVLGLGTTFVSLSGTIGFIATGQVVGRAAPPLKIATSVMLAIVLASGLMLSNSRSVLSGLAGRRSAFVRTPKSASRAPGSIQAPWEGLSEVTAGLALLTFLLFEGTWATGLMMIAIGGLVSLGLMQLQDGGGLRLMRRVF